MTFIRRGDGTFVCFLQLHSSSFVMTVTERSDEVLMKKVRKNAGGGETGERNKKKKKKRKPLMREKRK